MSQNEQVFNYLKGTLGFILAVIFPLMQQFGLFVQIIGGLGGLILLYLSIRNKYLEHKILKRKLQLPEDED